MASYLKKLSKGIKEVYYSFGETETFEMSGKRSSMVSKEVSYFSCDVNGIVEGEGSDGEYFAKEYGINKKKWRISDE